MNKNKTEELTKLLSGFLTELLPGGTWETYTEPKQIAQEIVKNLSLFSVSNSVVCKINMRPENCYYRDITMECKGCRNNANNCC